MIPSMITSAIPSLPASRASAGLPASPHCTTHLMVALHPDLMRLARRLADSESEAQDLAQETLLKLWRRRHDLSRVDDLRAYARAALRNLYRQGLRRAPHLPLEEEDGPSADPEVFASLALSDLQDAIARLPREQAALMALVMAGETSPAALAGRTGCAKNTVMSRLARARAQLRREMDLAPGAPVASLF
ncbi:RNA polymerase sigma-70 factor, ECF subfamily [Roseovarius nanhaiticus]|uniref:RNA polymerase sigma-70 factor, ECF subfamily n=1 Tax=Roseovarius nanhaiticus TaxID=573024 RepID=A0A1N7GBJ3_9RHOB|nr:RNA polymerase sigma factor [Roseovarius nanhaiticus]SEK31835.1 RNA polymerase sigma-70 factor, ECF subfamily [Roseovarius nanhaiticus]SIS09898.1 RNA polymerase sigma-70 factor, ECF subfamily [Roseovarius nanhaiticus]